MRAARRRRSIVVVFAIASALACACSSFETSSEPVSDAGPEATVIDAGSEVGAFQCIQPFLLCESFDVNLDEWKFPGVNNADPVLIDEPSHGKVMRAKVSAGVGDAGDARSYVQRGFSSSRKLKIAVDIRHANPSLPVGAPAGYSLLTLAFESGGGLVGFNVMFDRGGDPAFARVQVKGFAGGDGGTPFESSFLSYPYDTWQRVTVVADFGPNGSYSLDFPGGHAEGSISSIEGEPVLALGVIRFAASASPLIADFDNLVVSEP